MLASRAGTRLVRIDKITELLTEIEHRLLRIATVPPNLPIVARGITRLVDQISAISRKLVLLDDSELLRAYGLIEHLDLALGVLILFINDLSYLCDRARNYGVRVHPDPCNTVTLDYFMEWIVTEYERLSVSLKHATRGMTDRDVKAWRERFFNALQLLSSNCIHIMGVNCLKYASPEKVTSSPLRSHIMDLASATRAISDYIVKTYSGIKEWRVGSIRLYVHPRTTDELLDLAEYAANVLHKITELELVEPLLIEMELEGKTIELWWEDRVAVYSLADRVEIAVQGANYVMVKPGWIVDAYLATGKKEFAERMKRVLEEKGFKTELTGVGFKISIPPGDVREAVKLVCVISATIARVLYEEIDKAYEIAVSDINLVESKLREQKPLKRRKVSLCFQLHAMDSRASQTGIGGGGEAFNSMQWIHLLVF
jgi:hypothetical protein